MNNQEPIDFYMKIQPLVEQDARRVTRDILKADQYTVAATQGHVHNGIDSLQVDYTALSNKFFLVPHTIYGLDAAAVANYSIFFIAADPCVVTGFTEVHTTAGTDVGTVTIQLEKLTGTTAPGSGTVLLNTALSMKATANTVQTGSLVTSSNPAVQNTTTYLAKGDRLALKRAGVFSDVANVTVVVKLTLVP